MSSSSYTNSNDENPDGDSRAEPRKQLPSIKRSKIGGVNMLQTFGVLFAVGVVVTFWMYFQQNNVAPQTPLKWKTFEITEVERQLRYRNPVLIIVFDESTTDVKEALKRRIDIAEVRKPAHLVDARLFECDLSIEANAKWLLDRTQNESLPCLVLISGREKKTSNLADSESVSIKLAELLQSIRRR